VSFADLHSTLIELVVIVAFRTISFLLVNTQFSSHYQLF
jgi:hypothetical protein